MAAQYAIFFTLTLLVSSLNLPPCLVFHFFRDLFTLPPHKISFSLSHPPPPLSLSIFLPLPSPSLHLSPSDPSSLSLPLSFSFTLPLYPLSPSVSLSLACGWRRRGAPSARRSLRRLVSLQCQELYICGTHSIYFHFIYVMGSAVTWCHFI